MGGQPSPEGPGAVRGDLPPLLRWTFQQIIGGGQVHSGDPMPGHWASRRGEGPGAPLHTPPPREWVGLTREGLLTGAWCPPPHGERLGWGAETGTSPFITTHFSQCLKSKSPHPCAPGQKPQGTSSLEKDRERGTGRGTCPQGCGAQPVAPTTVSWTAQAWSAEGEPVHPPHPGSPQKPNAIDRQEADLHNQ